MPMTASIDGRLIIMISLQSDCKLVELFENKIGNAFHCNVKGIQEEHSATFSMLPLYPRTLSALAQTPEAEGQETATSNMTTH